MRKVVKPLLKKAISGKKAIRKTAKRLLRKDAKRPEASNSSTDTLLDTDTSTSSMVDTSSSSETTASKMPSSTPPDSEKNHTGSLNVDNETAAPYQCHSSQESDHWKERQEKVSPNTKDLKTTNPLSYPFSGN